MMQNSTQYERVNGDPSHSNPDDADEEAQLITREDFEFEDGTPPSRTLLHRRLGFLGLLQGRDPPRTLSIRPFFSTLQEAPSNFLETFALDKRLILGIVLFIWFIFFAWFLSAQRPITDADDNYVINLDCVDTFWRRKNGCGIDGVDCRPFSNQTFAFRCPAKCGDVNILNPRVVGSQEYNYMPLVIGTETYRGDSFICGSAIHAGIIEDGAGGCGRITLTGRHENFASTKNHGIESLSFDSYFPLSFTIASDDSLKCSPDPRSALLPVSLVTTALLAIFSTSPRIFFPIFVLIFAHVSLASDPPTASYRNTTVLPDHISMLAKRLLPAIFVASVLYISTIKRTLTGLTAHFEKAILWLGGFWIGALSNYTFDWIPISRLTAHDLQQQPGAKLALAVIIILLFAIIMGQIYCFWIEARLLRYLNLYGLFVLAILTCLAIPGVNLRIHHYILALLLLPGTSLQTRPSLLYQGILIGLFVNGIARWDFDSVLQTSDALRNDARFDSVIPEILDPTIRTAAGEMIATFMWGRQPDGVDGISVLVNDVERDRLFIDEQEGVEGRFEWTRSADMELHEYFRFAYVKSGRTLDYSQAGTLFGNGTYVAGEKGSIEL
ncbi:hypothetical protein NX059_011610 [Plenodomus lindquistii]|nr:hypothetical protein NX059_011610 [Plenodomus lindquistii]